MQIILTFTKKKKKKKKKPLSTCSKASVYIYIYIYMFEIICKPKPLRSGCEVPIYALRPKKINVVPSPS